MKTNRLFVFGCSFTNYAWPSWADIVGLEFDTYENWAYPGLGNRAISERVAEVYARESLGPGDTVIVQWTSHLRHDWHATTQRHSEKTGVGWKTSGSIFNYLNEDLFDEKWIKTFFDEASYIMHTLNYILLTKQFLESIGVRFYMTSMGYINKMNSDYPAEGKGYDGHGENFGKEINVWKDIPTLEMYKDKIFDNDRWLEPVGIFSWKHKEKPYKFLIKQTGQTVTDRHPTITHHNDYANMVLDKLSISQNQTKTVDRWIDTVQTCYDTTHKDFEYFCESINDQLSSWRNDYRGF